MCCIYRAYYISHPCFYYKPAEPRFELRTTIKTPKIKMIAMSDVKKCNIYVTTGYIVSISVLTLSMFQIIHSYHCVLNV